jgi:hypothetical protein
MRRGVRCLYGTGYKNWFFSNLQEEKSLCIIIDETVNQLATNIIGYGSVLNQYIVQYLESISQRKEI